MTVVIEKKISLESKYLNSNIKKHIFDTTKQLLFSNCSKEHGHIIDVIKLVEIMDHEIDRANCSNIFTVKIEIENIKPEVGAVMTGNVCMLYKDGIFIEIIKGKQKMLIPKLYLKDYTFNDTIPCYEGEKTIKEGDTISAKITACQYNNKTFNCFGSIVSHTSI